MHVHAHSESRSVQKASICQQTRMNTKTTSAIVGVLVAMSLAVNAMMAQQAGAGKPQQEFKGPVKVFILAGQSNMEGHGSGKLSAQIGKAFTEANHRLLCEQQVK